MDELTKLLDEISLGDPQKEKEKEKEKISETELYKKYKASYSAAFADLGQHAFFLWGSLYALYLYKDSYMTMFTVPLLALMLNRTFIIFHDCVHGSYTPSPIINYLISHFTGIFVLTSPNWIIDHHTHHLTNGNIENEYHYFFNETVIMTKRQYLKLSDKMKLLYFLYKQHYIFFGFIPIIYYVFLQRFVYIYKKMIRPLKFKESIQYIFLNHIINNLGVFVFYLYMAKYEFLYLYLISFIIFSSITFIVFHNQHTYNPSYVVGKVDWTQKNSGIYGSSFIQIPFWLEYFYMGIEYHHIHHMNAKIPGYHLQQYHEEVVKKSDLFDPIVTLSLWDCYRNLWLVLYDEDTKKYIRFDELDSTDQIT